MPQEERAMANNGWSQAVADDDVAEAYNKSVKPHTKHITKVNKSNIILIYNKIKLTHKIYVNGA